MNCYKPLAATVALMLPALSQAQTLESVYKQYQVEIVLGVAALVCFLALIALFTAWYALRAMTHLESGTEESSLIAVKPGEEGVGFWRRLWNRLNDSVPVAQEATVMTDHSYDGIRELDNRLPPWWLYGFYATIVFGVIYLFHYHVFETGKLMEDEYVAEMQEAEAEVQAYLASMDNLIDETSVSFTEDPFDLSVGQELFVGKCAACHGQKGEGGVGPNFTDQYWIHGGDIESIFKIVKYGVPSKGMISWQSQLTPKEMQQVSSYIITLEGTDPPNQKDPQGELYERSKDDASTEPDGVVEAGM